MPRPAREVTISRDKIGERIRRLREANGWSQGKLAEILDSHPQNVSQLERGLRGVTVQQVVRLARALQVTTDEILGERTNDPALSPLNDRALMRRIKRIRELPPQERKAVLTMLDGALSMARRADGP